MATTASYKKLIKLAKAKKIETIDELEDLVSSEEMENEEISGGDFECALKQLKIKRFN